MQLADRFGDRGEVRCKVTLWSGDEERDVVGNRGIGR